MVIKEIAPSKNAFNSFLSSKSENLLKKITRANITKNNYAKFVSFNFCKFYARYRILDILAVTSINQ